MLLLDTSGLLAALDGSQRHHAECVAIITERPGPFLLSPFVLAEVDYLLATRVGLPAARALLAEVARGAFRLEPFDASDVDLATTVIDKYGSLALGLADASIVVLAARHALQDVLTLDRRHFGVVRQLNGRPFRVLP